jgi:hypothetical protein
MNYKKISLGLVFLIFLGYVFNFGINHWIKYSLPTFIVTRNDTPYNFKYSDVSYSFFQRQMVISDINIAPKSEKKGIYTIKVKKIIIHGVKFIRFMIFKDLAADLIEIDQPNIIIQQNIDSMNHKNDLVKYKLGNSIQIRKFEINNGNLVLYDRANGVKKASLTNLNLHLSGVLWYKVNNEKRIPVTYDKIKLEISDIFYQLNEIHQLQLKKFKFKDGFLETNQILLHPNISEDQFKKGNYLQKSLLNVTIPTAKVKNLDWGYDKNGYFFLKTSKIVVDSTHISIKEKKITSPPKTITEHIDRIIPFNLSIDTIQILKSKLNFNNHITSNNINIEIQKAVNKVNDKITLESLKIYDNFLVIKKQNDDKTAKNSSNKFTYLFDDVLEIKNFIITDTHIQYSNPDNNSLLEMGNINYSIHDININTIFTNTKKYIPFSYSKFKLEANHIIYNGFKYYNFKIEKMLLSDHKFVANNLNLIPTISPKNFSVQKGNKNLFKIHIKHIILPSLNWNLANNNFHLQASSMIINEMDASIYQNSEVKVSSKKIHLNNYDLNTEIRIDTFLIGKSTINQYNAANRALISSVKNLKLSLHNIIVKDSSDKSSFGLPFSFSKFNIVGKNIYHDMGYHTIHVNNLLLTNSSLYAKKIKIRPQKNQLTFMRKRGIDAYTINLSKINITQLNFGSLDKEIEFSVPKMTLQKMETSIHQFDIPDNFYKPVYKPFFSEKLRKLKFKLNIKEVDFINSSLTYEEESLRNNTGKIFFTDINAKIKNLSSGYKASNLPDIIIDFKSNFMNSGKLTAIWKFNPLNKTDYFTVRGKIYGLQAEKIEPFIKPYLNISVKGDIKKVSFDYNGNNNIGSGSFGMVYKDLWLTLYKKDGKREKKFLSSLTNLTMKKNSRDTLKMSNIKKVERSKDKSFFNFLWKLTLSGLKETLFIF